MNTGFKSACLLTGVSGCLGVDSDVIVTSIGSAARITGDRRLEIALMVILFWIGREVEMLVGLGL